MEMVGLVMWEVSKSGLFRKKGLVRRGRKAEYQELLMKCEDCRWYEIEVGCGIGWCNRHPPTSESVPPWQYCEEYSEREKMSKVLTAKERSYCDELVKEAIVSPLQAFVWALLKMIEFSKKVPFAPSLPDFSEDIYNDPIKGLKIIAEWSRHGALIAKDQEQELQS